MIASLPSTFLPSLPIYHSRNQRKPLVHPTQGPQPELTDGSTQMSLPKVFEPRGFRAFFAHRWSLFLRENYRNHEEVSVVYGVRYQTALNWWQGINRPSGDVVALACMRHGSNFIDKMGE